MSTKQVIAQTKTLQRRVPAGYYVAARMDSGRFDVFTAGRNCLLRATFKQVLRWCDTQPQPQSGYVATTNRGAAHTPPTQYDAGSAPASLTAICAALSLRLLYDEAAGKYSVVSPSEVLLTTSAYAEAVAFLKGAHFAQQGA